METQQRQTDRAMLSQKERFDKAMAVKSEQARLKLERETQLEQISLKFKAREAQREAGVTARRKAAITHELKRRELKVVEDLVAQDRSAFVYAAYALYVRVCVCVYVFMCVRFYLDRAIAAYAAMEERDVKIEIKRAEVIEDARAIGVNFRRVRAVKLQRIMVLNKDKEEHMALLAAETKQKLAASEVVRKTKLVKDPRFAVNRAGSVLSPRLLPAHKHAGISQAEEKAKVELENRLREEQQKVRMGRKRQEWAEEHEVMVHKVEEKVAVVSVRLAAKEAKLAAQIKAAKDHAVEVALGRELVLAGREEVRLEGLRQLEVAAEVKAVAIEQARERVEETLELRAADSRLHFAEKQANIRRQKRIAQWCVPQEHF